MKESQIRLALEILSQPSSFSRMILQYGIDMFVYQYGQDIHDIRKD